MNEKLLGTLGLIGCQKLFLRNYSAAQVVVVTFWLGKIVERIDTICEIC